MLFMNLINYNDIGGSSDNITLFKSFNDIIKDKLDKGLISQNLINTQDLRGIGKTYQLIEFAKKHNYIVVVATFTIAKNLREKYKYNKIYSSVDKDIRDKDVIIDELVDINQIEKEMNCKIITGFITSHDKEKYIMEESKELNTKNELSFTDKIIEGLKTDALSLSSKITKSNEVYNNQGDLKLLVNNLKTTMELIQELEGKGSPQINQVYNVTVESKNAEDFISKFKSNLSLI